MKSIRIIALGLGLLALPLALSAQLAQSASQITAGSTPDSIVRYVADEAGLTEAAPESLPVAATYWVATSDGVAPWPCAPLDSTLPTYAITPNAFLVDMTFGQVSTNLPDGEIVSVETALTNLAASVAGVIQLVESAATPSRMRSMSLMSADDLTPPGDGDTNGYSGYTNSFVPFVLNTNLLSVELFRVDEASGIVYASLHRSTNENYFILSTTNLATPLADWQIETLVRPTDTNSQPFTLLTQGRDLMFFRAFDATGVDSDADGVPDWFSWLYWGTINLPDTNLDYSGNGNTFAQDYSNNIAPTEFSFTGLEVTNNYVNVSAVPVQLDVAGRPYYLATLIDDTNFTNANWQTYATSNVTVNLGLTEGWHDMWVGLRGHGDDPTNAVWQQLRLNLDFTPPALTITNPALANAAATVAKPYLQLQGFAGERLASVSYDVSNADGTITNQVGFVTDQTFDAAAATFTTNYFQCFDVPLATNDNYLTLRVTDLAGNTTTTNFDVVLDYSAATNPPVVTLTWPQDGMNVSGTNLTIRGTMSDETGSIEAQAVDGDGTTNTVQGLVERDGVFWIENVPVNGTNQISIQATDAAGNMTTTNITIYPGTIGVTISSTPTGDGLYQSFGTVSGTVGDSSATVTVNGVAAMVSGNDWTATNVPVAGQGTAVFDVAAQVAGQPPVNGSAEVEKPAQAVILEYGNYDDWRIDANGTNYWRWFWQTEYTRQMSAAGTEPGDYHGTREFDWNNYGVVEIDYYDWTATNGYRVTGGVTNDYSAGPLTVPDIDGAESHVRHYFARDCHYALLNNMTVAETAHTKVKLFTGGKSPVARWNVYQLQCYGTAYGAPQNVFWTQTPAKAIPPQSLVVGGLGSPGSDGNLWVALPDNIGVDISVQAPADHYDAWVEPMKYSPYLTANDVRLAPSKINATNCVGQKIIFKLRFDPGLPGGMLVTNQNHWVLPGKYVNAKRWFDPDLMHAGSGFWMLTTCDPVTTWLNGSGVADDPYCTSYQQTDWPLTQPETGAWWISGGPKSASCYPILTFSNGQKVSLGPVRGNFYVDRPQANLDTNSASIGPVAVESSGQTFPAALLTSGDVGFSATVKSTSFSGQANWVQLIKRAASGDGLQFLDNLIYYDTFGNIELDNDPFYNTQDGLPGTPPVNVQIQAGTSTTVPFGTEGSGDRPGVGIASTSYLSLTDSFNTYLVFNPDPDNPDNIWVTLGRVDWGWSGYAAFDISNTKWVLVSGATNAPTYNATDDFAVWYRVYHNSK